MGFRWLCLTALWSLSLLVGQRQLHGSSALDGTILSNDLHSVPVEGVRIALMNSSGDEDRATISDGSGRFQFDSSPTGVFILVATKAGYLRTEYGATRMNGPGIPLALVEGHRLGGLVVHMPKGGIIRGVIRDSRDRPVQGVSVRAVLNDSPSSAAHPSLDTASGVTDALGAYRIFGLSPGHYLVVAVPAATTDTPLSQTKRSEVEQALRSVRGEAQDSTGVQIDSATAQSHIVEVQSYYPGTSSLAAAVPVDIADGQELDGIDFNTTVVTAARITGRIGDQSSRLGDVRVWIQPRSPRPVRLPLPVAVATDHTFVASQIPPGSYVLAAEALAFADSAGPTAGRLLWSRMDIEIGDRDVLGLQVSLQPGVAVSGRIEVEPRGATTRLSGVVLRLVDVSAERLYYVPTATTASDGSYSFGEVAPGRYQLVAGTPGNWHLLSVRAAGTSRDFSGEPIDIPAGRQLTELVSIYTTLHTGLTGHLFDEGGQVAPGYFIVIVTEDQNYWGTRNGRIRSTRVATDGSFEFADVPAGNYVLAVANDVDLDRLPDPSLFIDLARSGLRVKLTDGTITRQDIRMR